MSVEARASFTTAGRHASTLRTPNAFQRLATSDSVTVPGAATAATSSPHAERVWTIISATLPVLGLSTLGPKHSEYNMFIFSMMQS
jgi:hypothetical protein